MGRGHTKKGLTRGRSMGERPTQSRERGQGGNSPLAGSRGGAPLWGLGQRPNCSTGDQYAKRAQQRRRQRSVPASNFAHPQMRPPACSTHPSHIVAPNGRDRVSVISYYIDTFEMQGFASVEATRSLSLTPSARTPMFLVFSCCLPFLAAGGFAPLDAVGHRRSRCCRRNPASARFQAHPR